MMMMNMTQMKLVNSATKFRHGMDKFYQPNSGLGSSRSLDEAIYTYIYTQTETCLVTPKNSDIPQLFISASMTRRAKGLSSYRIHLDFELQELEVQPFSSLISLLKNCDFPYFFVCLPEGR